MKNIAILLVLTFSNFHNIFSKSLPPYLPQNGLIAWLPFNGNANDESGNNNNGTFIKATLGKDRFGNLNSAYDFDGLKGQYIIGNNSNLPNGKFSRSFAMWVNYMGVAASGETLTLFSYGQQSNQGSSMLGLYQGKVRFISWENELDVNYDYKVNSWMHIVGTFDGTIAKLYVDGILIGFGNYATWNTLNSTNFFIGTRPDSLNSFFNGSIDDIGIWNRALSSNEIQTLYQSKLPDELPAYLPKTGLLAWFPFNGSAIDESGNGNDVISNSAQLTTDVNNMPNKAYQFNAKEGQFIKCLNANMPTLKSNRTFSMWLKADAPYTISETMTAFGYGNQSTGASQMLGYFQGKHRYMGWGNDLDIVINYNTDDWYHYVATYDGIQAKVYLNGVALDSLKMYNWNTSNSTYLHIGTRPDGINSFFNGKIDDIGIWSRVLSRAEIIQLHFGPITSTHEFSSKKYGLIVSPNPAKDFVTIKSENEFDAREVVIFNLLGEVVLHDQLDVNKQLNLQGFPKGLYFLRFKDLDQPGIKIIKE